MADSKPASRAGDLRAEFSDLIRVRLREAAASLFSEKGYKAATVREIAAKAKLTHTTFYNYFGTKEAVLYAILSEIAVEVTDAFHRVAHIHQDRAAFDSWFDSYNDLWKANSGIYVAFWEAMLSDRKIAGRTRRQLEAIALPMAEQLAAGGPHLAIVQERLVLWYFSVDSTMLLVHTSNRDGASAATVDAARWSLWQGLNSLREKELSLKPLR